MDPSFLAHQLPRPIVGIEGALYFLNVISFLSCLHPVSEWFGNQSLTSPIPSFLHNLQNAHCKFSSNSNQGKVSSHFLFYLQILDPDLEGSLEVELKKCFLRLGCTSISDTLPFSESLELETTEDLDALLKYKQKYPFLCLVYLCNLYTTQYDDVSV